MANIGRPTCDEGVVRASPASAPCTLASAPWVLAATIIGSAMAFIDGKARARKGEPWSDAPTQTKSETHNLQHRAARSASR
jgi:hypothetical protein